MPKLVDHGSRRAELGSAVWSVVAKQGLEGVTIREVARESGWSTGVVSHYFRDKEDLMQYAFDLSIERSVARLLQRAADMPPLETIRIILLDSLAITDEQRLENCMWGAFVGRAFTNPDMSDQIRGLYGRWQERLVRLIRQGQEDGSIRRDVNAGQWSRLAMAIVDGYVIQAFYLPGGKANPDEQVMMVNSQVNGLAVPAQQRAPAAAGRPRGRPAPAAARQSP
jgi:AcrR family transcriptional regulator